MVWGGSNAVHLNLLIKMQKRVVRIIHDEPYRAHTKPLFRRSQILRIEDVYKYLLCVFVYKNRNLFTNYEDSGHETRQNRNLRPEFQRLSLTQKSIKFTGPTNWNIIPERLKNIGDLEVFKKELKCYLISQISN